MQAVGLRARKRQSARQQRHGIDLGAQVLEGHASTQKGCSWSEHIAAVEGRTGSGQVVFGVVEHHGPRGTSHHRHRWGEETVVGSDQIGRPVAHLYGNGAPVRSDPGIDHRQHHPRAQVLNAASEGQRSASHVERCDPVGHVGDLHARRQRLEHRVHDTHELVVAAVVGQEGDVTVQERLGGIGTLGAVRLVRVIWFRGHRKRRYNPARHTARVSPSPPIVAQPLTQPPRTRRAPRVR